MPCVPKSNIMPFFFGHSHLSKYFVECIDTILKATATTSEQTRLHLLEASFTNVRGGTGKNVETDLVMEHSVRNKKKLVRNLGANKTEWPSTELPRQQTLLQTSLRYLKRT